VNIVRRAEVVPEVKALGGDVVLVDGPELPQQVAAATENALIRLAFDGVGDLATQNLLSSIGLDATVVVWSGMSGKPFTVSGPRLLFFSQTVRGFWIFNWFKSPDPKKITAVYEKILPLIVSGALSFPMAGEYSLEQHQDALAVAAKYSGKAILRPGLTRA
jgi:NADPH:quinone reductase-like Zn-dependent oxidoreductase